MKLRRLEENAAKCHIAKRTDSEESSKCNRIWSILHWKWLRIKHCLKTRIGLEKSYQPLSSHFKNICNFNFCKVASGLNWRKKRKWVQRVFNIRKSPISWKAQTFMKIFENSECAPLCKSIETKRFFQWKMYFPVLGGLYDACTLQALWCVLLMNSQCYQLFDAINMSDVIASDLQHLHAQFTFGCCNHFVSRYWFRFWENLWINCKNVGSQLPCNWTWHPGNVWRSWLCAKTQFRWIEKFLQCLVWVLSLSAVSSCWNTILDLLFDMHLGKRGRNQKSTRRDDAYSDKAEKIPAKWSDGEWHPNQFFYSSQTYHRSRTARRKTSKKQLSTKVMKEKRYKWARKYRH